ncbi:MAG: TIGR02996 domain-containing protein [Archangium sp.]|nr:TIGR02996 domain-containing protein [Archangium sp.]
MTLARVEAALPKKPDEALELMLELWRKTFDPELGKLIERLGAQLAKPIEGLSTKKRERAESLAKLAAKTPPAQRSAVLDAFEIFAREATGALVWPSVEAWAEVKPDPRVARMGLRVLTTSTHQLTAKLWRRLTNCVEQHADLGVVEEARAYETLLTTKGGGWGFSPERFSNVLKKLTAKRKCSEPSDAAAIARLSKAIGSAPSAPKKPSAVDDSAMIEAIVAAPNDDTPRLVYADWLTEHQDPRGEFITLQIQRAAGGATKASRAREEAILADHRRSFLGPLAKCVEMSGLRFDRGFLARAKFNAIIPVHPLLRLIERADFGVCTVTRGAKFDSLRALTFVSNTLEHDEKLLKGLLLTELSIHTSAEVQATLDMIAAIPSLSGLKHLALTGYRGQLSGVSLAKLPATLESLEISRSYVEATFKRTPAGWDIVVNFRTYTVGPQTIAFLSGDAFTKGVAQLTIEGPKLAREALEPLAARLKAKLKLR